MADKKARTRGLRASAGPVARRALHLLVVLSVTAASGLIFGLTASGAHHRTSRDAGDLVGLVRAEQQRVESLRSGNDALQARIQGSPTPTGSASASSSPVVLERHAVEGPGVQVTLTDAPEDVLGDDQANPDALVVHQEDIEAVMNALWRGGAEAMSVQGARVSAASQIRCIGNVILVDGTSYSPPYVIAAIGDPQALRQALGADPQVAIYRQYVAAYDLGWEVRDVDTLHLGAVEHGADLRAHYARPLADG